MEATELREVKLSLLLAQAARVAPDGTVSMIGAGISVIAPTPQQLALAGTIEMPWSAAGVSHDLRFELIDADGAPVCAEGPAGQVPVVVEGQFQVAPAPVLRRGTPLTVPIGINFVLQQLDAASRYEWRFMVDGQTHADWRLGFSTLPKAQSQAA